MRLANNCRDKTATAAAHGYGMKAEASASYDNSRGRSKTRGGRHPMFDSKSPVKYAAEKKVSGLSDGVGFGRRWLRVTIPGLTVDVGVGAGGTDGATV